MRTAKLTFIYSTIVVFLCFSAIGALGAFGKIEISGWATTAAIVGPILAIVSAAIGAEHIFDDPEAITELKNEHADVIREIKGQHADTVAEHAEEVARLQSLLSEAQGEKPEIMARKDAELARERDARMKAEEALSSYERRDFLTEFNRLSPSKE